MIVFPLRFLVRSYYSTLGFGAVVEHFTTAFYTTLHSGRVFVIDDEHATAWAKGCRNDARFECFFRPTSKCLSAIIL